MKSEGLETDTRVHYITHSHCCMQALGYPQEILLLRSLLSGVLQEKYSAHTITGERIQTNSLDEELLQEDG